MIKQLTDSRLANLGAKAICEAFGDYQTQFRAITQRAAGRFAGREWRAAQMDAANRLDLYKDVANGCVAEIHELMEERVNEKLLWTGIKAVYSGLIDQRDDWELGETFFNSITRRLFTTVGLDPQIEFVDSDFETPPTQPTQPIYRVYGRVAVSPDALAVMLEDIIDEYQFGADFLDKPRNLQLAAQQIEAHLQNIGETFVTRTEMVGSVFYRNKGAYLVGRMFAGSCVVPLVLAVLHNDDGLVIDTVLLDEDEVSVLFSFTRSYFQVEVARPYALVRFLRSIMPRKKIAELYISIGYNKHGKTLLYRDLLQALTASDDEFRIASGQPGMVMSVFTLPSYDAVFKIIKDYFAPPKNTTRQQVMAHYQMVFQHDRAGRLIDAQEFEHLKIERSRISPELLDELKQLAKKSVTIEPDYLDIKHVYVERRVIPLNIYIYEKPDLEAQAAIIDLGFAIKDLAATNIFPGDMFLKNFGVTRHGRVVFYDYDELAPLTSCNFRIIPPPTSYNDELWAEPGYSVRENDIFPEEFLHFLGLHGMLRDVFVEHHADLLEARFWQETQARIRSGEVLDIFPYNQNKRLLKTEEFSPQKYGEHGEDVKVEPLLEEIKIEPVPTK